MELIFLGTGTSEGIPRVSCLTAPEPSCRACLLAADQTNKNRRRNTGLIIKLKNEKVIMVDCGKFFWEAAMKWFPAHKLIKINHILITHSHNDACYGIDDLRDWTVNAAPKDPITLHVHQRDFGRISGAFPYLVDRSLIVNSFGGGVATLNWNVFESLKPLNLEGMEFELLEVKHGSVICLGYKFNNIVYLSDISGSDETLEEKTKNCKLLIVDALRLEGIHPSHWILPQTLEFIRKTRPKQTYLIGMNHDIEHESTNMELKKLEEEGLFVQLAYDGMKLVISDTE